MTRYTYRTPGTRLWWSNVAEWCVCAQKLDRRRYSRKRNRDLETHGGCMPLAMIQIEEDLAAIEAAIYLLTKGPRDLAQPLRGQRSNHPTTPIIVALKNRAAILRRDADDIPEGANWQAVHDPNHKGGTSDA